MAQRILCVLGKLKSGGVESIMFSYYNKLDKNKYQYDFVYEETSDYDIPEEFVDMGAKAFCIPAISSPIAYMSELKKIIKKGNYRIVHSNLNTLSVFSLFVAAVCKVKYRILHNHSTSSNKEKKRDLLKKILRPLNLVFANKKVACSELAARWMYGSRAFESGSVQVLNNGIDVYKFKYDPSFRNEVRVKYNVENKKIVGHVGRFVTTKNHLFMIDVFSELVKIQPNSVLMLVGDGELSDTVKEYVREKELTDNVIFTGVCNDVYKYYSAFDVFVLPSLYEGLPVVAMEACASGLPVVLSEQITKECAIADNVSFLPIDDTECWVKKIIETDIFDRESYAEAMVGGPFDINKCVKELESYYDQCV